MPTMIAEKGLGMMNGIPSRLAAVFVMSLLATPTALGQSLCGHYGPQTPRDISNKAGANQRSFPLAGPSTSMNLCNIHFHAQAEHKGPGFSVSAGKGPTGGFKCNAGAKLSKAESTPPSGDVCKGLKPGDTIEVHWVYSSCDIAPGKGLGACLSEQCSNPALRVETQVFLVVNSKAAADFTKFDYAGSKAANGLHQPKALPTRTGAPVVFAGSTTGPSYSEQKCSPLQVTWSVRPQCAKVDINSLQKWCQKNSFSEDHAHGVRDLVTAPALLSRIR